MAELDRIRWRCRRGLLELDLVLARFLERSYAGLTPAEHEVFKGLLERSDNDLWDLLSGKADPQPGPETRLVRLLRGT
jgi:antitoxin CptB